MVAVSHNIVIITAVLHPTGSDDVFVQGTVNGQPTQAHAWMSHLTTLANTAAVGAYLAGLLNATITPAPQPAAAYQACLGSYQV